MCFIIRLKKGQKDIVAITIDNEGNCIGQVFELNRINSSGNESAPFYDEENKIFYFATDARPGFGRNDLFLCKDFEVVEKIINPFNAQNCGATINSNLDDISVMTLGLEVYATSIYQNQLKSKKLIRMKKNEFIYELHFPI